MRPLLLVVVLVAVHLSSGMASAQSEVSTDVGVRTWITSGYTKWNFAGGDVDVLSELRWRGTDAVVIEGYGDFNWRKLVLIASVGGGRPNDGILVDDDFAFRDRQGRFSHTLSKVDGSHIIYGTADVGYRAFEWHEPMSGTRGFIDVFVGYQYWEEEYEAFGIRGVFGLLPFTPIFSVSEPNRTQVITHSYSFHSVRIGARATIPLGRGFAWRVGGVVLPYTRTELEDIHHLRDDLQQNPSFSSRADGGFGYQLDAAISYTVWRGLSIEAGYRHWRLDSGSGTKTTFPAGGAPRDDRLNEIVIERGGPYFGAQYRF